jgi:hypothetical protein
LGTVKSTLGKTVPLSVAEVYHGDNPEGGHQLVEAINEDAVGIRNKLGRMQ